MLAWIVRIIVIWTVRIVTLLGAAWAAAEMVHRELGYRMEYGPMIMISILMIVVVRVWMPWSTSGEVRHEKVMTHDDL